MDRLPYIRFSDAAKTGNLEVLKETIQKMDPTSINGALYTSCAYDRGQCVEFLLSCGGKPDSDMFYHAAAEGNLSAVHSLLSGANLSWCNKKVVENGIKRARQNRQEKMAKYLIGIAEEIEEKRQLRGQGSLTAVNSQGVESTPLSVANRVHDYEITSRSRSGSVRSDTEDGKISRQTSTNAKVVPSSLLSHQTSINQKGPVSGTPKQERELKTPIQTEPSPHEHLIKPTKVEPTFAVDAVPFVPSKQKEKKTSIQPESSPHEHLIKPTKVEPSLPADVVPYVQPKQGKKREPRVSSFNFLLAGSIIASVAVAAFIIFKYRNKN